MGSILVVTQGVAIAVCASFNAVYFSLYLVRRPRATARRVGAAALTVVNLGLVGEALFLLGLYGQAQGRGEISVQTGAWLLGQFLALLGVAFISALILRQMRGR